MEDTSVTLVEGASFCVCAQNGDVIAGAVQGIYHADSRLLSRFELRIDDEPVEPLQVLPEQPYHVAFLGRARPRPGRTESTLLVRRDRYAGGGMREEITLTNLADEPVGCVVGVAVDSDVADLFDVKTAWAGRAREVDVAAEGDAVRYYARGRGRGARVTLPGGQAVPGLVTINAVIPPRGEWEASVYVQPIFDGAETADSLDHSTSVQRQVKWGRERPAIRSRHQGLMRALARSSEDLGALRLFNPDRPDEPPSIAAGAPWFMTLFGRDALLTSWMALPLDQSLALGTLRRLAGLQGERTDALSEEEPGKIPHELRQGGGRYFGSVDATPLFVMLLGELRRWGLHRDDVEELLPYADRALEWIERSADYYGFLKYQRKTDKGLINQGWKDSVDGITFADGTIARPPIALAEVQGYVYSAYIARAHFAHEAGDEATERRYARKAADLKQVFNARFWLPERGYYALGLDAEGRPIDALASNMGHCLMTGIIDEDRAHAVHDALMSDPMFSGYGVRTLASTMRAYNPMSYHNGAVWPHENALIASGLMRYGFASAAQRIATGLLDAAEAWDGRLPELFCGFDRAQFGTPVPYPTACMPQASAAAAAIHLLRVLIRFDPWVPYGKLWVDPALPESFGELEISGLPLAGARITVDVRAEDTSVTGLPEGIELIAKPRHPLTAAVPAS